MVQTQERRKEPAERIHSGVLKLEFGGEDAFGKELRRRVDDFFGSTGRRKRGGRAVILKTAIILTWFVASYVLLVLAAQTLWQGLVLAVSLGLATAAIGMNIQHDAGHGAYSERGRVNRVMATTMDLVGGSSYTWRWKHTVIHHKYVNITGYDTDIDIGRLGRYTPHQRRLWYHRWQHVYLWVFYAFYGMKVQLVDSWRFTLLGRIGRHRIPRPKGGELALFLAGKAVFLAWAFAIPMLLHPVAVVLFYYVVAALMLGVVMVLVFIVPHLKWSSGFPCAPGGHRADGKPLDGPSDTSSREFCPAQPGPDLVRGRTELSQGAPPVPGDLPRQLPLHRADRRADLPRVRDSLHGAPVLRGGYCGALPMAAADGGSRLICE